MPDPRRVLVVLGTRPEAIKLAPVVLAMRQGGDLLPLVCATAQHRAMLDEVLELFGIHPDYDLDIMREDQSPTFVTTEVLRRLDELLPGARPEMVLVQGDTATAMSAGLAAYYRRIPVGHVEAGLRTDDRYSPFPEEMMRRILTQLATVHFAATERAAERLRAERVDPDAIHVTGNPVVDAVLAIRGRAAPVAQQRSGTRLILVTAHRRENFGAPLLGICRAVRTLVERHLDIEVVYAVHPNPNVAEPVRRELGGVARVSLVPPLRYDEFIALLDRAYLVLSDSGGVQEEAPVLGKPVLVLRENTERPEAVEANATMIVGTDPDRIVKEASRLLEDRAAYAAMSGARSPFGDGHAAERIVAVIRRTLGGRTAPPTS